MKSFIKHFSNFGMNLVLHHSKTLIMKSRIFLLALVFGLSIQACSTCYECTNQVELIDGNGNVIDTTENTEEFCTADGAEVEAREGEGADCKVQ